MEALSLNYQRNGIYGIGFYQFLYYEKYNNKKMKFLATFTTEKDETIIDRTNCRVVCLDDFNSAWRGDNIAYDIQTHLINIYGNADGCLYNLIAKVNKQ
jgi:hypothetical protein